LKVHHIEKAAKSGGNKGIGGKKRISSYNGRRHKKGGKNSFKRAGFPLSSLKRVKGGDWSATDGGPRKPPESNLRDDESRVVVTKRVNKKNNRERRGDHLGTQNVSKKGWEMVRLRRSGEKD